MFKRNKQYTYLYDGFVKWHETDSVGHRTKLKIVINPVLRLLQFYTNKPYVIASIVEKEEDRYKFLGYQFCRVYHSKK